MYTLTVQLAVYPPSSVVTVMVVVPVPTEVTLAVLVPVLATVATAGLELVQVMFLFAASFGVMVAVRTSLPYVPFWI